MTWGYVWGIWWWRSTGTYMNPSSRRTSLCNIPPLKTTHAHNIGKTMSALRNKGTEAGIPLVLPMDVVVAGKRCNIRNRAFVVHQWNGFVAMGSICEASKGNYVCSPEFCLLQVTCYLRRFIVVKLETWQYLVILVELCCELCGTYSKQNTTRGFKNRTTALTSTGALLTFCGRMTFEQGSDTLHKALRWTLDNLNSPMETVLYLLLCLPCSHGGLGFMRPVSNQILEVPRELYGKTSLRHIVPDLFWPEFGLIVEFNGAEPHAGHEVDDQERMEIAQDMGYKVVTFRKEDLLSRTRFLAKAQSVANQLQQELPPNTTQFVNLQTTLMNMLLRHERWI